MRRALLTPLALLALLAGGSASATPGAVAATGTAVVAGAAVTAEAGAVGDAGETRWVSPATPLRVRAPFAAPAHAYGAGHRGVDLAVPRGGTLVAPAEGTVLFSAVVVDRTVITIAHDGGLVTTLEPVADPVPAGAHVGAGEAVARAASGGHTPSGAVHFGVRRDGVYINPLLLLGDVPRAVLLPCC